MPPWAYLFALLPGTFLPLGAYMSIAASRQRARDAAFQARALTVLGTVVDLVDRGESDDGAGRVCAARVEYEAAGMRLYVESVSATNPPLFQRGQLVKILVDPKDANHAELAEECGKRASIGRFLGLVFLVAGALLIPVTALYLWSMSTVPW